MLPNSNGPVTCEKTDPGVRSWAIEYLDVDVVDPGEPHLREKLVPVPVEPPLSVEQPDRGVRLYPLRPGVHPLEHRIAGRLGGHPHEHSASVRN